MRKDITGWKMWEHNVAESRWEVVKQDPNNKNKWLCKCKCGNNKIKSIYYNGLIDGRSLSCGCLRNERIRQSNSTHGESNTRLYGIWLAMRKKCENKNFIEFYNYGGRGISVCNEWTRSFESFRDWSLTNGYEENLSIDRIDTNGNYCPENCRWADAITQANNTRRNNLATLCGETKTVKEWSRVLNIPYQTLMSRLHKLNWDVEKAFTTPPNKKFGKGNKNYGKRQC